MKIGDAKWYLVGFITNSKRQRLFMKHFTTSLIKESLKWQRYVCTICGYTQENEAPEVCPTCGATKDKFVMQAEGGAGICR